MRSFTRTAIPAVAVVSASLAFALAVDALAAGGGSSGNSMPSVTAPQYDPAVEYQKGLDAMRDSRFKDAERAFDHVLSSNSRHPQANFLAGFSRANQGNDKSARKFYEKAIKYDAELILAHRELALSSLRLGDGERAKTVLDRLKARAAECADACDKAADLKAAISTVEAAIDAAMAPAGAEKPAEKPAGNSGSGAARLPTDPKLGDRLYTEAIGLINEGRYEVAIERLQQASLTFGPHPDILTYIGFAHRKLGRYGAAEDYYRQALAAAPRHLGATEYYGELMVERGDLAGARRMLAKLDRYCEFGCAEADELRRWIAEARPGS